MTLISGQNGNAYTYHWLNNKLHEKANWLWSKGIYYDEDYYLDKKKGHGILVNNNDVSFHDGEWSDGK